MNIKKVLIAAEILIGILSGINIVLAYITGSVSVLSYVCVNAVVIIDAITLVLREKDDE